MGSKGLLKKLAEFFDMDIKARNQKKEEFQNLVSRLKKKEKKLKKALEEEKDDKLRDKLSQKLKLVHTQRKKGVSMLKELRDNSVNDS